MQYKIIKNYNEYLEFCKSLYNQPIMSSSNNLKPYFNDIDKWVSFFNIDDLFNEENEDDEFIDLTNYKGNIKFKPDEKEYPIVLVYSFNLDEDLRNGNSQTIIWHWNSLKDLGLKINSKQKCNNFYYSIQDKHNIDDCNYFYSEWFNNYEAFCSELYNDLVIYNAFYNNNKPIIIIKKNIEWDDLSQSEKDNLEIHKHKNFLKLNEDNGLPLKERIWSQDELKIEFDKLINS